MRAKCLIILLVVLLTACNSTQIKGDVGQIYIVALESILEQEQVLNENMEYIAIDTSDFEDTEEKDIIKILSYFEEKYSIEVLEATLEQLKEEERYDSETMILNGVLLRIDKFQVKSEEAILFEGSKYRSGDGAVDIQGAIYFEDNQWKSREVEITSIS